MTIDVYPLGIIEEPSYFVDIFTKDWKLVCTIVDLSDKENLSDDELDIKEECILYNEDNIPNIYVNQIIDINAMKKGLKMLEKANNMKYNLICQNLRDLDE